MTIMIGHEALSLFCYSCLCLPRLLDSLTNVLPQMLHHVLGLVTLYCMQGAAVVETLPLPISSNLTSSKSFLFH
jgi:hypothetical protein